MIETALRHRAQAGGSAGSGGAQVWGRPCGAGHRGPGEKGTLLCSRVGVLGASFCLRLPLSQAVTRTHAHTRTALPRSHIARFLTASTSGTLSGMPPSRCLAQPARRTQVWHRNSIGAPPWRGPWTETESTPFLPANAGPSSHAAVVTREEVVHGERGAGDARTWM